MSESTDQILVHLEYIREKQDATVTHLERLNARTGKVENRVTALEARGDEARTAGARWGGFVGGAIAAATAAVWHLVSGK